MFSHVAITKWRSPESTERDAGAGLVEDLAGTRETLGSRYDDLKSGKVKPVNGEAFFESLRQRENELLNSWTP